MDTAVALVQAYLQVNGYFTVVEYPVLEAGRARGARVLTDLDILAFRFPGAGRALGPSPPSRTVGELAFAPDPELRVSVGHHDMIVGEVKEGRARLNHATRDPMVLMSALARFGCCPPHEAEMAVRRLLREGLATLSNGHCVRLVAFGADTPSAPRRCLLVPMEHVLSFLRGHLLQNWESLRHVQLRQPALALLALITKFEHGGSEHRPGDERRGPR
jgi:hypothetical protein